MAASSFRHTSNSRTPMSPGSIPPSLATQSSTSVVEDMLQSKLFRTSEEHNPYKIKKTEILGANGMQ